MKTGDKETYKIDQEYELVVQGIDAESKKVIIMDDGVHSSTSESDDSKSDQNLEEESISEENLAEDSSDDNSEEIPSDEGSEEKE